MSSAWDRLLREVIRPGLCTRCGACGAVSDGAIGFPDRTGACLPELVGRAEDVPDVTRQGCGGREVDFPALNDRLFGKQPVNLLLGTFRRLCIAHATDAGVRRGGASGGVLTAAALHLLRTGQVAGVWVQGMDRENPCLPKSYLARTEADVLAAAQSKYVLSPHLAGLGEAEATDGPLAFVGLPCQVHALRKLQSAGHELAGRFRYVLGAYCGNILHFGSIRTFLSAHAVRDLSRVRSLDFRAGDWPGNLRIELFGGRVIEMPKFHANYLIPFHIMRRCLLCADLANEFADLSGGDAWAPRYEERGKGFSLVIARSQRGEELLQQMQRDGQLWTQPIEADEAMAMHSHGLDLKKRGAFLRIKRQRRAGRRVPEYGFRLAGRVPLARRIMEAVMGLIFRICWTRQARRAVEWIPDRWIGLLFQVARKRWKGATRATKKTGLGTIRFEVDPPGQAGRRGGSP